MSDDTHDFWEKQAEQHGTSDLATAPDHHYRNLEVRCIKEMIAQIDHDSILDVGCGNGYSTIEFAKSFPASMIIGVDYSPKMIEEAEKAAKAAGVTNVSFFVGDILSISRHPKLQHQKFDIVLSERCLINLANWDEQKLSILQMRKLLMPQGHLMLVENTKKGLERLNTMRGIFDLPAIEERWHNFYIPDDKLEVFIKESAGKVLNARRVENIGNLYYIVSRVVYAALAKMEGKEPSYDHPLNEIASKLPTLGEEYACSPNFLMIFQNVPQ